MKHKYQYEKDGKTCVIEANNYSIALETASHCAVYFLGKELGKDESGQMRYEIILRVYGITEFAILE
jgi:hypothetical protein